MPSWRLLSAVLLETPRIAVAVQDPPTYMTTHPGLPKTVWVPGMQIFSFKSAMVLGKARWIGHPVPTSLWLLPFPHTPAAVSLCPGGINRSRDHSSSND